MSAFFYFDLGKYLNFHYIQSQQQIFLQYHTQNPVTSSLIFFVIYIIATSLSLPGATVLTLLAGALFGLFQGFVIVSFASSIGATVSFLASRFLLKDRIQARFGHKLKTINEGMQKDGGFYLFSLRLIPVFPFFLINLLMGLTPIKTTQYYLISQIGMIPGTLVYVNAGTELSKISSLKGIVSPSLLISFALLGLLPIASKKLVKILGKENQ
ncbi:MAG: TVP38/TMEM64 family protein [Bdellovibrionaceae bacterium]|jgi:uncharacterized membrane protein YdjX (TVP38/TMEM64 family)|nr:TVP38/TMEM64 family protein [Pseudobdellovibrionaceae bacterium]